MKARTGCRAPLYQSSGSRTACDRGIQLDTVGSLKEGTALPSCWRVGLGIGRLHHCYRIWRNATEAYAQDG
jgi:hypothetical protein